MKLLILSDFHTEIDRRYAYRLDVDVDVVVLAGDIGNGANGISWAAENFKKPVTYVPGNHEYYKRDIRETQAKMREMADFTGVHLLDDDVVVIDGVRFIGSTLWTDFELYCKDAKDAKAAAACRQASMDVAVKHLNDFRLISHGKWGEFTPSQSVDLHRRSLAWLKSKIDEPFDGKTVVISHHLPSRRSVAERFDADILSACYASNLDHLFGKMDLWIHGHTHDSFDYVSGGTRVVTNPRGYLTRSGVENRGFNPGLVVGI